MRCADWKDVTVIAGKCFYDDMRGEDACLVEGVELITLATEVGTGREFIAEATCELAGGVAIFSQVGLPNSHFLHKNEQHICLHERPFLYSLKVEAFI